MKTLMITFLAGFALVSCNPKTTSAPEPEVTLNFPNETIASGYELYGNKCGRCHKLKTVDDFSRQQWDEILPRMAKKANLEGDQEATVNEYINWELGN